MRKHPPANEGDVGSIPGLEDALEEEIATHSVFLPGEFQGQNSLAGYSPWGQTAQSTKSQTGLSN